jgi:hypothetical protein
MRTLPVLSLVAESDGVAGLDPFRARNERVDLKTCKGRRLGDEEAILENACEGKLMNVVAVNLKTFGTNLRANLLY